MDSKQESPGSDNKHLRWPSKDTHTHTQNTQNMYNIENTYHKNTLRNLEKLTLWIERLKRERELKSTMSGRKLHAFTICLLKSLAVCVKHGAS